MAIGNSIPIDVSLLEDIEQSALQLSSQLEALLAGLQSHLQQVLGAGGQRALLIQIRRKRAYVQPLKILMTTIFFPIKLDDCELNLGSRCDTGFGQSIRVQSGGWRLWTGRGLCGADHRPDQPLR